jgi:intein/homing endonuclease
MTERDIALALKDLSDTGLVVMDRRTVAGLTAVYDPWSYTIETESAARLRERMVAARPTPEMQARYVATLYGEPRDEPLRAAVLAALERIGTAGGVSLTPLQTESVVNALCEPVSVITGLPGSGKTTCLRMVVLLLQEAGVPFLLLAPTGIAAKRVASVTGSPAFTIHRAFAAKGMETSTREATYAGVVGASEDVGGIGDGSDEQWGYSGDRPHPAEVVIIDESSMVDQHVLYRTLQCTRSDARLVFVGDAAQLPSVGPGNVLRDLIAWRVCATVALTEIFRQASASPIIRAAHDVHRGVVPQAPQETDFSLIPLADERDIQKKILSVAQQLYEARENFQVLSPRHAGLVGVTDLNTRLREQLNPKQASLREVSFGAEVLREDDRVMVVRNDYKLGLFNGDLGKVTRIDKKSKEIEIKIHGPPPLVVKVPFKNAATLLRLAYAVTVHKCVHPDTLVETSEGLLPLRSISDTGIVGTPRGPRPYHTKVENPPARMLRITTEKGYQICSTPDHGVDVWRGGAFVRVEANEIREGDHLRLSLGVKCDPENPPPLPPVPLPGDIREKVFRIPSEMSLELAEFLGLMVAGGSLSREGFSFFKRHLDVVERFSSLSETLFGFAAPVVEELNGWRVEGGSTDVARWLSAVGGLNPHQKAVPECVARSPERYQRAFLRGVFEDGTVNVRNGAAGPRLDPMEWVTAYESLARYVHRMLLRAEIPSVLRRTKGGSNWVLYVYGAHAARFGREVGFISKFKQERLSYASGAPVNDYVPVTVDEARALVAHYRKTTFPYNVRSRLRVSLAMLERLETSEITPLTKTLRARAAAYTVRVVRVDSEVAPSMCVTVPDGHQFIQGGFYGWNCQGLEHDVIVMPMTLSFGFQLQRNLFYTAITRARRRVVLVGTRGAMERAVTNARENERNTLFLHRLRDSEDAAK